MLHRDSLGDYLNCLDLTKSYVEVGVLKGEYSSKVASLWKGSNIYLIDQWCQNNQADVCSILTNDDHSKNYQQVLNTFKNDPRVQILKSSSIDASKKFNDKTLDCVYLDGDHSYVGFMQDLIAWWPKIRNGGILSGHDYANVFWGDSHKDPGATWTAVKLAIKHFFTNRQDASCVITSYEDSPPSWFVFKIEEQIDPKDILVLSCATSNLTYSTKTEVNHRQYCDKHGYDYLMLRDGFWADAHPAWSKLKFISEHLASYRWIMWLDADAVFVNQSKKLEQFLIPRMGHISSTWHAFGRLQLTNGISFWQNIPWTWNMLRNAISYKQQFANWGVWEEEGIRRALDADIMNYGKWLGIEVTHFNSWPHFNTWLNDDLDLIHHWGGASFRKNQLVEDSLAISRAINS